MKVTVWQRLDLVGRMLTPSLIVVALVIISVLPLHIPGYSPVIPSLVLMAVYYWVLHRPDLLPAVAVFFIGILHDILTGGPLGVQASILLVAYWVTGSQRGLFLEKSFLVVWWGFMMIAAGAAIMQWILMSLIFGTLIVPQPAVFAYLLTVATYPLFAWAFARAQRTLPRTV